MFASKFNKAWCVSIHFKLAKTMSSVTLARSRCLHRFFCTVNDPSNNTSQTRNKRHHQTILEQEPIAFSPSQTKEILDKFNSAKISGLLNLKYLHNDCAHAIIEHRKLHGHFASIEDLLKMPHMGPKILPKICKHIIQPIGDGDGEINESQDTRRTLEPISPADEAKILKIFNEHPPEDLARIKTVGWVFAKDIVERRCTKGEFKRLGDVLEVPHITDQKLLKICKSILIPPKKTESDYTRHVNGIQNIQDLVTLDIGPKHIAWLQMTRDREVLDWTLYDIEGVSAMKWQPHEYLKLVKEVISKLPTSDVYLLEHKPHFGRSQKDLYNYYVYTRSLEAMFLSLLNTHTGNRRILGAISVSRNITGRHFGLLVGSNRASGQQIVDAMLNSKFSDDSSKVVHEALQLGNETDSGVPHEGAAHHFIIERHLASFYKSTNQHQKEQLSNCLLHALAFYETVMLSDTL